LTLGMEPFSSPGSTCSRLVLGAAQLGMPYGVVNKTGRPSLATARTMVRLLVEGGVMVIDTAAGYGTSEEVIGSILDTDASLRQRVLVVTKLDPLLAADSMSDSDLERAAVRSIDRSLKNLRMERLALVLFHRPAHLGMRGGLLRGTLGRQVESGKVAALGASVYTPAEGEAVLAMEDMVALQVPASVFDHRFLVDGLIERAAARGVTVFARSAYLQGVVVSPPDRVPYRLSALRDPVSRFQACCASWNRSPAEVALAFVRSFEQIRGVVVGMERVEQARQNLAMFSAPLLTEGQKNELLHAFAEIPEQLINPSMWPA
jgi:aryl-alcohol dehydrogenase-like predicted oxidoreductase